MLSIETEHKESKSKQHKLSDTAKIRAEIRLCETATVERRRTKHSSK